MVSLARRDLIGSDSIIVGVIVYHFYQAIIFLTDPSAFGALPMNALLTVFYWPQITAAVLFLACILAVWGTWIRPISAHGRLRFLILQQSLLVITALGSIVAIVHGSFADIATHTAHLSFSPNFILSGEAPRICMPFFYTAAMLARVK